MSDPYRQHLPIVQVRAEVSSCGTCKHEWSMVDSDHRQHSWCDLIWHGGMPDVLRREWYDLAGKGKCPRYEPTPWTRLKQWLRLTERRWYLTERTPEQVRGTCSVCKAAPGVQCDAEIHVAAHVLGKLGVA